MNLQNSNQVMSYAQTTFYDKDSPYGALVDIAFNTNEIEGHCEVTLFGAMLHEGIHAEMFRQLKSTTINPNDKAGIWDEFESQHDDHNNMSSDYIDYLIESLKNRYGSRYTDIEYEAIAWHGLGDVNGEGVITRAWSNLSYTKKSQLKEAFANVNKNCEDDECK